MMLRKQLLINARLGVKALGKACGHHLDQIFVAGFVFTQQDQVAVAVNAVHLIKAGAGRNINLTADDRLDARRPGSVKKRNAAIHNTVVSDGTGRLAHLLEPVKHPVNAAGTVQQAVLGMHMQVGKLSRGVFRHGSFPFHWARRRHPGGQRPPGSSSSGGKARLC